MFGFEGSSSKATVRAQWDAAIIQQQAISAGPSLAYFGLPGPKIEDLICWLPYLRSVTAVERLRKGTKQRLEDLDIHRRLLSRALYHRVPQLELLRGSIEEIILDGQDLDRNVPRLASGDNPTSARFRYDLVNLDYCSGLAYRDGKGDARRILALQKLFERQHGHSFLLIMTMSVRDNLGDELTGYLQRTGQRATPDVQELLQWYTTREAGEHDLTLKAVVPLVVKQMAELRMFETLVYPTISYDGTGGERMTHFVFELRHVPGTLSAFGNQSEADILKLPHLTVDDGHLHLHPTQVCSYSMGEIQHLLAFLAPDVLDGIVTSADHTAEATG